MAARWSPSRSERMALWKNKKIKIGGLRSGLFSTHACDGEVSIGFTVPAITATPPPPSRCWRPGNGVAILVMFGFRIQTLETLKSLSDCARFLISLSLSVAMDRCFFSLSLCLC
ncbi:hypothetical protein CIPAW_05G239900 [Carya illinoinensis]|uniref:Uncharacterized protein n=1 Tax=Carya illinoinensis TaxID=32201 RepID=A0A8T1QLU9_CARIL|nr:hypothetical protein CIPAW_05G239900 [Carya illinoinensis]